MIDKYTPIHNEVLEQLCRINLSPYETRILFALWRKTSGFKDKETGKRKKKDWISGSQFTQMTGLDRRLISRALKGLKRKLVISRDDKQISFSKKFYKPLSSVEMTKKKRDVISRDDKKDKNLSSILIPPVINFDTTCHQFCNTHIRNTKENTTKETITKEKDIEFLKVWNDYLEMRIKIHKPATERAKELTIKKLNELAPDNKSLQIKILEQSIQSSWQSIFPLKQFYNNKSEKKQSTEDYSNGEKFNI